VETPAGPGADLLAHGQWERATRCMHVPSLQSGTLPVLIVRDFASTGAHERAGGTCGRV